MSEYQVKNYIGLYIIALHSLIFVTMAICFARGGYSSAQIQTIAEIIVPLFLGYCTAAIGHFIDTRYKERRPSKKFSRHFIFIAFLLPTTFTALIIVTIVAQARGGVFTTFEEFKAALFAIESIFALNVGRLIYTIFRSDQEQIEVG